MFPLIPIVLASIYTSLAAAFTTILTYIVARLTSKAFFLTSQIITSTLLIVAHTVVLAFFVYFIMFVYNQLNSLSDLVDSVSESNEYISVFFDLLRAVGLTPAFSDVFDIFSPFLTAYLVYRAGSIVFYSLKSTSDELFKVGVLFQQ